MRRQHPDPRMSIPISLDVWNKLISASVDSGYEKEDWEVAAEAIYQWTRKNNPNAIPMPVAAGYQWKRLFLPAGTLLRTVFGGKNHHCTVEADQILYNGKPVSPSAFVNAVGGIRRNAWRCTWILFPDSKDWKLADTLRTRERPRRSRKPARDMQPTPAAQSAASRVPVAVPPAADALAAESERIDARASEAPNARRAIDHQVPRTNTSPERRSGQQHISLSPPGFAYGTDRRRTGGDERIAALLRQELLPLLYRICACDGMLPDARNFSSVRGAAM